MLNRYPCRDGLYNILPDAVAVYDRYQSRIVTLDALGSELWLRMDGQTTLRDMATDIAGRIGAELAETLYKAIAMTGMLSGEGLIYLAVALSKTRRKLKQVCVLRVGLIIVRRGIDAVSLSQRSAAPGVDFDRCGDRAGDVSAHWTIARVDRGIPDRPAGMVGAATPATWARRKRNSRAFASTRELDAPLADSAVQPVTSLYNHQR